MEASDDLTTAAPSSVDCAGGLNLLKQHLRSVVMSKLAFDTYREFNPVPSNSDEELLPPPSPPSDKGTAAAEGDVLLQAALKQLLVEEFPGATETQHAKDFCRIEPLITSAGDANGRVRARVALMYRHHLRGVDDIVDALWTMLKEIFWFNRKTRMETYLDTNWLYLGPHCALVTDPGSEDSKVSFLLSWLVPNSPI